MLFFKTNMDRTEQCDCSIIYNLHIQLKRWQGGCPGRGGIKTTTKRSCKHPDADQTGVQIMSPTGFHWETGITASVQVWADGLKNGRNLQRNGTAGAQNGKVMMGGDFSHRQAPREVTPHIKTDSITDFSSLLVCFVCVFVCAVFLLSFKFIRKCFNAEVVWGNHCASHL